MQQQQSNFWDVLNSPPKFTAVLLCFLTPQFPPIFNMNTANTILLLLLLREHALIVDCCHSAPWFFGGYDCWSAQGCPPSSSLYSCCFSRSHWPRPRTISAPNPTNWSIAHTSIKRWTSVTFPEAATLVLDEGFWPGYNQKHTFSNSIQFKLCFLKALYMFYFCVQTLIEEVHIYRWNREMEKQCFDKGRSSCLKKRKTVMQI